MRKLALASLALTLLGSTAAFAQSSPAPAQPAPESLLHEGVNFRYSGWYLAPTAGFTTVNGKAAYVPGIRGAIMLNQRFGAGFAFNVLGTDETRIRDHEVREIGAYGGAYFQYILQSNSLLHAYLDTTIGSGGWCQQTVNEECDGRHFGFVEPTVNLEVNLARNVRLAAGAGYRAAIAERQDGHSRTSLSGAVVRTSLVFGVF
jgi:hypothetical protein